MTTSESPEEPDMGSRIRPYAITGGRTRTDTDLPIEAMVSTTPQGTAEQSRLTLESARIVSLCATAQSVAEISAHLGLHLGVTRVLVGDLAAQGLIAVHRPNHAGDRPDLKLLERVLDGLQAL